LLIDEQRPQLVGRGEHRLVCDHRPTLVLAGNRHRPALAPDRLLHDLVSPRLQRISPELYEAAAVDGARNAWQAFRYITFPQLRATSVAVWLLLLINAYQAFDEFFNLLDNSSFARPLLVYCQQ
jgi:hypothetical protein